MVDWCEIFCTMLLEGGKMNDFKLTKTRGTLLAIMNFLVSHFGLGNFIVQVDIKRPARARNGTKDYKVEAYTDTECLVTCDFWIKWEEGKNPPNFAETHVFLGHYPNGNDMTQEFREVDLRYSPDRGIFVQL